MGASLLAMAVRQSTSMLDLMPSSRASSLPQCFVWLEDRRFHDSFVSIPSLAVRCWRADR
ncbi:hypothetical protein C9422_04670 [Pseudomonas sp. B1(2018)]|nr:hypothetical protein C9422_04670 [Pseudomonas sp. B1(2018)]